MTSLPQASKIVGATRFSTDGGASMDGPGADGGAIPLNRGVARSLGEATQPLQDGYNIRFRPAGGLHSVCVGVIIAGALM